MLAWRSLHVVVLTSIAFAAIGAARLVMAAATEDQADLLAQRSWDTLADLAAVAGAVLVASVALAAGLVATWGMLAGRTAAQFHLDAAVWTRGAERAAGRALVVVGLAMVWRWAPGGPEQLDRVADLAAGILTMVAAVVAAGAVQRLLVVITTTELQRAEWLLRLDSASAYRPKSRDATSY